MLCQAWDTFIVELQIVLEVGALREKPQRIEVKQNFPGSVYERAPAQDGIAAVKVFPDSKAFQCNPSPGGFWQRPFGRLALFPCQLEIPLRNASLVQVFLKDARILLDRFLNGVPRKLRAAAGIKSDGDPLRKDADAEQ